MLLFHGLADSALLPGMLNDTWTWVQRDLTLVTLPGMGHWTQTDASERVTETMLQWLTE